MKYSKFLLTSGFTLLVATHSLVVMAKVTVPSTVAELRNAQFQPPKRPSCVKVVTKTIEVTGTLDGKGCVYTWQGAGYPKYCRAPQEINEHQPAMFNLHPGAKLINLQMECALDGIHTSENNVIDNVINRDVEEDAITIGRNITIRNSRFYFCQDKCLQMNTASNVTIENNYFYHSNSTILANYGTNITVRNNYFYQVRKPIRAVSRAGVNSVVNASGNHIYGADCGLLSEVKGKVIDGGGNTFINVDKKICN